MQNAKQYITETQDGYELSISVNEQCGNYTVESIDFFVAKDEDEGCGDLAVSYDISNLQNEVQRTVAFAQRNLRTTQIVFVE